MVRYPITTGILAVALGTLPAAPARAQEYKARLDGSLTVRNNNTDPMLTNGIGKLTIEANDNSATYSLTYSGLSSKVTQAHFHFGKTPEGGIYAFLCTNLGNGPAGTPACPAAGETVTGTITPASILPVREQDITAGNFTVLLAALAYNSNYVKVHTVKFPDGEIGGRTRAAEQGRRR